MFRANVKLVLDPGAGARIVDEASKRSVPLSPTEGRILALLGPDTHTAAELHQAAAGAGIDVDLAQVEALLSRLQANELIDYQPSAPQSSDKMLLPDDVVPAFRSDLGVAPAEKGLVKVTDRKKNRSFTIYDFELHIARLLDGSHKVSEVIERSGKIGIPVTPESLTKFIAQMKAYGFIKASAVVPAPAASEDATWGARATWSPEIREMFQSAMRQFRSGRPGHALEYLNALLSIQPDTPEAIELKERVLKHEGSGPVHEVGFDDMHGEGVPELVAASEPLGRSPASTISTPKHVPADEPKPSLTKSTPKFVPPAAADAPKPSLTKSNPKFTPSAPATEEPKPSLTKSTPKYVPPAAAEEPKAASTLSTPKHTPSKPAEGEKPKSTTLSTPKYVPPSKGAEEPLAKPSAPKPVKSLFDPAAPLEAKPSPPKPVKSLFDPAAEVQAKASPPKPSKPLFDPAADVQAKPSPPKPSKPVKSLFDPAPEAEAKPSKPVKSLFDTTPDDEAKPPSPLSPLSPLADSQDAEPPAPKPSAPIPMIEIGPPRIPTNPNLPIPDSLKVPPLEPPPEDAAPPAQPKIEPGVVVRDSYLSFADAAAAEQSELPAPAQASTAAGGPMKKGVLIAGAAGVLALVLLIPIPSMKRLDVQLEQAVVGWPKSPAGVLGEVKAPSGSHVDEGGVLATLDVSKQRAEHEELQKGIAKLEAQAKMYASNTKPDSVKKAKAQLAKAEDALAKAKSEADKTKKAKDVDRCKRILAVTDGVAKAQELRDEAAGLKEKATALQAQIDRANITAPKSGVFQLEPVPAPGALLEEGATFGRITSGLMLVKGAPEDANDAVLIVGDKRVQLFAVDKKPEGLTVSFETGVKPGPAKLELAGGLRPWPIALGSR